MPDGRQSQIRELAGVILVDIGLVTTAVGIAALLRPMPWLGNGSRSRAAIVAGAGLLIGGTGALLPARETAVPPTTRLDDFVPRWQFAERHDIRVPAPPARVERAVRQVTASEIRLFRLLTWLRSPRLPGGDTVETILSPSLHRPILDAALGSGFMLLADDADELVLGTLVIVPGKPRSTSAPPTSQDRRAALTPARFAALADPGYAKAAMSFRWTEEARGRCRLSTETRVFATSPSACRRFAAYWRLIYPGSAIIRRMWLRAIRDRAVKPVGRFSS